MWIIIKDDGIYLLIFVNFFLLFLWIIDEFLINKFWIFFFNGFKFIFIIGMCIFLKCDRNVKFGWIIVDYGFKFEYKFMYYVFSGLIVWIMYGYLYIVIIK